jgi:pimeloyl-ACP methyl ester carboxylesterase
LFITGKQDQIVGYQDAWNRLEHYPRASFAVLDAAGHNVHLERQLLVEALIRDWLNRIDDNNA